MSNANAGHSWSNKLDTVTLVCVAASAGGIGALTTLLDLLPADLPLAMVIVQHLSPDHQSRLAEILGRHTTMPVAAVADGDVIQRGAIYVAPPGSHVIVSEGGTLNLTSTVRVQHVRPSADLLFASAAEHHPGRVIAIILTGMGHDGSDGVRAVDAAGGVVIVESPDTAAFRSMPDSALATGCVDYVVPLEDIPAKITTILESGATA